MLQRLSTTLKIWLSVALMVGVLSGCGSNTTVSDQYPLVSVSDQGNQTSRVYRADNQTVPEVAHALAAEKPPKEISKDDPDHMFLVYSDQWYHIQKDPDNPQSSLIEVDNQEFVRQHYNPSFLEGYIAANLVNTLFDLLRNSGGGYGHYGDYRGYSSRDVYRSGTDYHVPTAQEKNAAPPLTVPGSKGSIIKRGTSTPPSSGSGSSDGGSFNQPGTIQRGSGSDTSPKQYQFSPPRSNSPPKTRVGGRGSLFKRR